MAPTHRSWYALLGIVLAAGLLLLPHDLLPTVIVVLAILTIPVSVSAALLGAYLEGRGHRGPNGHP